MTQETFHKLTHLVLDSPMKPPANLFAKGIDDWHARARLAHFLAMPQLGKIDEAIELFRTVAPEDVDEENAEDVEEKVFALQKLADLERKIDGKGEDALRHIDEAIELAESTDFLYKYIMHQLDMGKEAEEEVDERIEAYKDIPVQHVSYLYYGYRFKAMRAAERGVTLVAKDYMHMALHSMEIPPEYEAGLEKAFSATHDNASWILNEVDRATPNPDTVHWDI